MSPRPRRQVDLPDPPQIEEMSEVKLCWWIDYLEGLVKKTSGEERQRYKEVLKVLKEKQQTII